jgi:hypothetical protein
LTETETEEMAVQKRRAEGTPCLKESFMTWKAKFEAEMAETKKEELAAAAADTKKKKEKVVDKSGRFTGIAQFTGKVGVLNEEEWENAQRDEDEEEDLDVDVDVDEELFDVEDDDLDDLDFEDDDDDDEEEEPDI